MINVKKSKQQAGQAAAAIIFIENKDKIFHGQKNPHYYIPGKTASTDSKILDLTLMGSS